MATHVLGIAMSVLVLLSGPFRLKPALAGVALAAMLATVQLLTTPASRSAAGSTQSALPVAQAGTFPFIGDPSAPAVEVLFDYRCPHCRDLHALLPQIAAEKHLAFVLCPTPLSPACNAYIPAGEDRFPGSCELAKAALALWQESPDAFREFDEWAFAAGPSGKWEMKDGQAALAKARELAGKYGINADLQGAGVRERLSLTLEIFGRTSLKGSGGIPRLVYGQQWLIPETVDAGDLSEMIDSLIKS
jgi:protein-disulfide isomerase